MLTLLEQIGLRVLALFEFLGDVVSLFFGTLSWLGKGVFVLSLTAVQMNLLGIGSLFIVTLTTTFTGMVIALQLSEYAVRYGVAAYAGGGVALVMAREMAPMISAIVLAGRAGSAVAAEIGTMKVTEQLDALRSMGVSATRYLVVPRFLACTFMLPLLCIFSGIAGTVGGAFVANKYGISYDTFFSSITTTLVPWDVTAGLIKAAVFGGEIALVACNQGFHTERGAAGVGRSTTQAVVLSLLMLFATNYILSEQFFGN